MKEFESHVPASRRKPLVSALPPRLPDDLHPHRVPRQPGRGVPRAVGLASGAGFLQAPRCVHQPQPARPPPHRGCSALLLGPLAAAGYVPPAAAAAAQVHVFSSFSALKVVFFHWQSLKVLIDSFSLVS